MERITSQKNNKMSIRNYVRLLCFLFALCVSGVLTAQNVMNTNDENQTPWFIGVDVGPRMFFADHARQLGLNDRVSGGVDIYIGRWWSPVVGTRIGGSWQVLKGATQTGAHAIDSHYYLPQHWLYRQQFSAYHLYTDLLFNVSNLYEGDNNNRFWSLIPFIGIGYINTWEGELQGADGKPKSLEAHEITLNVGLKNLLHVGKNVDLVFDIRGAAFKDQFKDPVYQKDADRTKYPNRLNNDTGGRPFDGILSVNIGVQFRFGAKSNPYPTYYPTTYVEPVPPPVNNQVEVITEWKDVAVDVLILFKIGQSTLSQDARVQLGFLAKLMRDYPESSYTITGYADEGTGNPELNYRLSNDRAKRVKDCLVGEFGISASRLKTTGVGGIENRYYNDPSLSRSAIIRPDKY